MEFSNEQFGQINPKENRESGSEKHSSIKWENLREYDSKDLNDLLKRDNDFIPSLNQAKGLLCYWLSFESGGDDSHIPWPDEFRKRKEMIENSEPGERHNRELFESVKKVLGGLDEDTAGVLSVFALDNLPVVMEKLNDTTIVHRIKEVTIDNVRWNSEAGMEVGRSLVRLVEDFLENKKKVILLPKNPSAEELISFIEASSPQVHRETFMMGLDINAAEHVGMRKMFFRCLAANKEMDLDTKAKVFGFILENYGWARELNTLREMMGDESLNEDERKDIEELLRQMLGLSEEDTVYRSLSELYSTLSFEKYPVSEFTKPQRLKFLEKLAGEIGVEQDDQVLDVATGTGWLVGLMRSELKLRNVWGVDVDVAHVSKARDEFGDYFAASSWRNLPFSTEQFYLVTCLGRSLPHCEEERQFRGAIREMARTVIKDGYLVFDMPDSSLGSYREALEKNRKIMMRMGCTQELADQTFTIVDGPKGETNHFYNRYAPPRAELIRILEDEGLSYKIIEEDIPNEKGEPSGDRNLVFVCRKA